MKKRGLSLLLVLTLVICLLPVSAETASAAGTGKYALIYQFNDSSDKSLSNWSKRIADQARSQLSKLGYECHTIMCGGYATTGSNGISAANELSRMAKYDIVFFTCHGSTGGSTDIYGPGGYIKLYKNLYISANQVKN